MYGWFLYWKTYKWLEDEGSPCIKVYSSKLSVSQLGLNWGEGGGFFSTSYMATINVRTVPANIYRTWLKICGPLNITPTCKSSSNSCHKLEARNYTGCLYTRLACTQPWPQLQAFRINLNTDYVPDILAQHQCLTLLMPLWPSGKIHTAAFQHSVQIFLGTVKVIIIAKNAASLQWGFQKALGANVLITIELPDLRHSVFLVCLFWDHWNIYRNAVHIHQAVVLMFSPLLFP